MIGHFPIYPSFIPYLAATYTNPLGIAYDVVGNRIAIVDFGSKVTFIDATTYSVLHTLSYPLTTNNIAAAGFDSVNNHFYLGEDGPNANGKIRVISGVDYSEITNFNNSAYAVYRGFCFDHSTDRMFVSCFGTAGTQPISTIEIYKISDHSYITSFNADKASGIEIDTTARKLYVAGHSSANVRVYDIDTFTLLNTITGSGDFSMSTAYGITQDPNNSDLMIVQEFTLNKLLLLRKSTNSIIGKMGGVTNPRMSVFVGTKIHVTQATINKVSEYLSFY